MCLAVAGFSRRGSIQLLPSVATGQQSNTQCPSPARCGQIPGAVSDHDAVLDVMRSAYRVYEDPLDLLHHLDELGVRTG